MKKILMTTLSITVLITTLQAEETTFKEVFNKVKRNISFMTIKEKIPYCNSYFGTTIDFELKKDLKVCENYKKDTYTLEYDNKKVTYSKASLKECDKIIFKDKHKKYKICINSHLIVERY
jgi:hypothetical protein